MLAVSGELHQLLCENQEFEFDIPFIHYAYSLIQHRLVNFSELVQAFPHLVKAMLKLRDRLNDGEMVSRILKLVKNYFKRLSPEYRQIEKLCKCDLASINHF